MIMSPNTESLVAHEWHRCTRPETGKCGGCYEDQTTDCTYEALAVCKVCGAYEGALLPSCPQRLLTTEENAENYKMYCNQTGPFEPPQNLREGQLVEYLGHRGVVSGSFRDFVFVEFEGGTFHPDGHKSTVFMREPTSDRPLSAFELKRIEG